MYIESVSVMLTERSWWNEIQTTNSKIFFFEKAILKSKIQISVFEKWSIFDTR